MSSESNTRAPEQASSPTSPSQSSISTAIEVATTPEEQELYAYGEGVEALTRSPTLSPPPNGIDSKISARSGSGSDEITNALEFDTDTSKYPASMTSSIKAHVFEGGLRYHAFHAGQYAFPNDEVEQNRDDMKHTMCLLLCQGAHFYAPVGNVLEAGGEVLDLGTGTGIWAIELGDKYPNTQITGIDLSPIQPNFVPENVHFFVDDFEEDWVDPPEKYDYIHVRHTMHSVRNMKAFLQRVMRHLKPGGYFEVQEFHYWPQCDDDSFTPQTPYALKDYLSYITAGLRVLGGDLQRVITMADEMKAAGFENVTSTTHKSPVGLWPRDKRLRLCGLFMRTAIMDGLQGISRRPLMALGWTQLQIEMFLVDVRKHVMDSKFHTYYNYHVIHGRKPLNAGDGEKA